MKVVELFSTRLRDQQRAGKTEVFQYESIPDELRRQIRKITKGGLGEPKHYTNYGSIENKVYVTLHSILCREYGKDFLKSVHHDVFDDLMDFRFRVQR